MFELPTFWSGVRRAAVAPVPSIFSISFSCRFSVGFCCSFSCSFYLASLSASPAASPLARFIFELRVAHSGIECPFRRRGGIEPLHVPMPWELEPRPGTGSTHPGCG